MAGLTASITEPSQRADPRIGQGIDRLDTPTLLLDIDASDRNLKRMADFFRDRPASLRPHFKNHKCVALARRQIAAGAIGMTCAKLGEAEVLGEHGFHDLLIANQVVGPEKMKRLTRLAGIVDKVAVAIDHIDQAAAISEAASVAGVTVGVLIEVDIGMGRCGVAPGEAALRLASQIRSLPGIRFDGLQAFEGHLVNVLDRNERAERSAEAMSRAVQTRRLIEGAGIAVDRISGCSSATYDVTGVMPGVDEVQAGTYVTMDRQYHRLVPEFEIALSLLVRVISRPAPGRAVLDVGVKGAGGEFGVPAIQGHPDIEIPFFLSEEHVVVNHAPDWPIGQPLHLIPSHACTTCNLHRELVVHRDGCVVDVWPIEASGHLR